jgi:4,5-dihydroxyphthalate decarboxylase
VFQPLADGAVEPEGLDLIWSYVNGSELFWRQLKFAEFDVSELSLSSFLIGRSQELSFIGIPVFVNRRFPFGEIFCNVESGVAEPSDLKGKRIGIPEYQMTTGLWIRGILQHEYGVMPEDVTWLVERRPELSHGGATGFRPPHGVRIEQVPPEETLSSMLISGRIDAAYVLPSVITRGSMIDKDGPSIQNHSRVKPLFSDPKDSAMKYYKGTGIFPLNHLVVVKEGILKDQPWVALNLFDAFRDAKRRFFEELNLALAPGVPTTLVWEGALLQEQKKLMGEDFFPYGIRANRKVLEAALQYSFEQGLTPRRMEMEQLFARTTLDS